MVEDDKVCVKPNPSRDSHSVFQQPDSNSLKVAGTDMYLVRNDDDVNEIVVLHSQQPPAQHCELRNPVTFQ